MSRDRTIRGSLAVGALPSHQLQGLIRRLPLTCAWSFLSLLAGLVTGTVAYDYFPWLMARFGWSLSALEGGRLYNLWVGLALPGAPGVSITMIAMLLFSLGLLEYRHGTRFAALGFFLVGALSSLLTTLLLWPLHTLHVSWANTYLLSPDMGSSSASIACWGLLLGKSRGALRHYLGLLTLLVLLLFLLFSPQKYAVDHLMAFPTGLVVGMLRKPTRAPTLARHEV